MVINRPVPFGKTRSAGVLCHPTSLPGSPGIGSLGQGSRDFIDLIAAAGFQWWQVLPLHPPAVGDSPYSAYSAFAGNPLLIDLADLTLRGDLCTPVPDAPENTRVAFNQTTVWKEKLLNCAADNFFTKADTTRLESFWQFCDTNFWLHDYALFRALHRYYGETPWYSWPTEIRDRDPDALGKMTEALGHEIGTEKYLQWIFQEQWLALRSYAAVQGIGIIGDVPIFVAHDSADVWCNRDLFLLEADGMPTVVAGVPPDMFSETGQHWGNPLYNWTLMAERGFSWWVARTKQVLSWYDVVRLDHFRGFEAAWHIPATAPTAQSGFWVSGPGAALFDTLAFVFGHLPFIAEDLGIITEAVVELRERFALPGMLILQFAFDSDSTNPYLPHNHIRNAVVYSGTHDNETLCGWLDTLSEPTRTRVANYIGTTDSIQSTALMRLVWSSVAATAIVPLQDLLHLDKESRMNIPGTANNNWGWRATEQQLASWDISATKHLLTVYGRYRS